MSRYLGLLYGVLSYVAFLACSLYFVGFLGNVWVPRSIDSAPVGPVTTAILVNVGLVLLFGVQHSVMARPGFKRAWTRIVPQYLERSTYCLFSVAALAVVFAFWQPMGGTLYTVENPVARVVIYSLFASGWLTIVGVSFLINHFDLFGLRQVWAHFRGVEYKPLGFVIPGPYRYVRHPLYIGWLLAFWATPTMTVTHLVFALGMTAYILVAIRYEERDLVEFHGERYAAYRRQTPMLIPGTPAKAKSPDLTESQSDLA